MPSRKKSLDRLYPLIVARDAGTKPSHFLQIGKVTPQQIDIVSKAKVVEPAHFDPHVRPRQI
ncbi:hypothetical protein QEV83_04375 [Methylocapsa sp. D3K7]|uniref:hypothetical protein n=1 Tax=Methylocapsa sp. D3K7 TaxID=3041435 RepID=UPI00244EAF27|nr:hypothetical protein [Methylocapsa sp. D3K7]WGJ15514.1 hypothetical protein QEV83_04375 [Methylocapsa sp. D3K7]